VAKSEVLYRITITVSLLVFTVVILSAAKNPCISLLSLLLLSSLISTPTPDDSRIMLLLLLLPVLLQPQKKLPERSLSQAVVSSRNYFSSRNRALAAHITGACP
jgi:hypothetical protein